MPKEVGKSKSDNAFGILSVTFGILSIVLSLTLILGSFAGAALGILGLIFGIVEYKKSKNKWATWGIILSVVGIVTAIIFITVIISALTEIFAQLQDPEVLAQIQNAQA